jgi:hypothetical protein
MHNAIDAIATCHLSWAPDHYHDTCLGYSFKGLGSSVYLVSGQAIIPTRIASGTLDRVDRSRILVALWGLICSGQLEISDSSSFTSFRYMPEYAYCRERHHAQPYVMVALRLRS